MSYYFEINILTLILGDTKLLGVVLTLLFKLVRYARLGRPGLIIKDLRVNIQRCRHILADINKSA